MRRAAARVAPPLAVLLALATPALAGWKEVPVEIAVPAQVQTFPGEKVLVAMFRSPSTQKMDTGLEVARWMKSEVARGTSLSVIDVTPPEIPEQRAERLAVNDAFWRRLGEDFHADMIVAGIAEYRVDDRSGFVTEDVESPLTGQTVRRTRYAERRGYRLKIDIFFLKGDNGALLHQDTWLEDRVVEGSNDELQELYDLLEAMKPHLARALLPTKLKEPRYIWVD